MSADRARGRRGGLGRFLLLNIFPIAGLAGLVYAIRTERIALDALPEPIADNVVPCLVLIAVLFVVASILLPLCHGVARHFRIRLGWSSEVRQTAGALRKSWEWLLWPFRTLFAFVFAVLRGLLIVTSFALILAAGAFIIRMVKPDFLDRWIPVAEWVENTEVWIRSF